MIKTIILEGVQEQAELRKLKSEMLDYFAIENHRTICHNFEYYKNDKEKLETLYAKGQGLRTWEYRILNTTIGISNYTILKPFLFNYQPYTFGLKFTVDMERNEGGYYSYKNNQIVLNFYPKYFVQLMLNQLDDLDCTTKIKKVLQSLHGNHLIHELQHAYDAFRSKNKYGTDKRSKKYYSGLTSPVHDLSDKDMHELYLTLPHEYWARFTENVNRIMFAGKPTFQVYFKVFNENFEGWNVLRSWDKKRLIKALYKYYLLKYPNKNSPKSKRLTLD